MLTGDFVERHLHTLQSLTKAFREQEFRDSVDREVLQMLIETVSKLNEGMDVPCPPQALYIQLTAECFRSQRNACVQCPRNQNLIRDLGFIKVSLRLLRALLGLRLESTDCLFEALRCGVQFLGNLAVGNQVCKDDIWMHAFPHLFLDLLDHKDRKTAAYASMLLYTCLDSLKVDELTLQQENLDVAKKVIGLCQRQPELDWTVLIVTQHFFKSSKLVEKLYVGLSNQERVMFLELVTAQLVEPREAAGDSGIPAELAKFLASCFLDGCRAVLELASCPSAADEEALTVIRLLDVLCEMTSDRQPFMFLQDHPTLLSTTVELLKEVHFLGKVGRNIFSAQQDFSMAGPASHPAVSFKAHLVRLIANLCHGNSHNQNKVREMDGIALILDNCNIDSNNPFISQWAIFALRVILDHNRKNQEVVQALERRGVADDSTLRKMGFRLEERDGSLLLKPIRKEP
ncbi:ataxin-10 isoform X1 [Scleropages formosus]|nr:ataxin-10 isoform X1 [Scleropages formosus]